MTDEMFDSLRAAFMFACFLGIFSIAVHLGLKGRALQVAQSETLDWVDRNCIDSRMTVSQRDTEYLCNGRWIAGSELVRRHVEGRLQ